jgi:hypothetical protein
MKLQFSTALTDTNTRVRATASQRMNFCRLARKKYSWFKLNLGSPFALVQD